MSSHPTMLDDNGEEVPHDRVCRRQEIYQQLTDPVSYLRNQTARFLCGCPDCDPKAWTMND